MYHTPPLVAICKLQNLDKAQTQIPRLTSEVRRGTCLTNFMHCISLQNIFCQSAIWYRPAVSLCHLNSGTFYTFQCSEWRSTTKSANGSISHLIWIAYKMAIFYLYPIPSSINLGLLGADWDYLGLFGTTYYTNYNYKGRVQKNKWKFKMAFAIRRRHKVPSIFYPTFFLLQLNPTYMKRILHLVSVTNITIKSSYNWFKY